MKPDNIIKGSLFSKMTLEKMIPLQDKNEEIKEKKEEVFHFICDLYKKNYIKGELESSVEKEFVIPILEKLNWFVKKEDSFTIEGKQIKLDFTLLRTEEDFYKYRNEIQGKNEEEVKNILSASKAIICENKRWGITLDNLKAINKDNPANQIKNYLNLLNLKYGFLTNGQFWRIYGEEKDSTREFIEINLKKIIEEKDLESFSYFYHLFQNKKGEYLQWLAKEEEETKRTLENSLKKILYEKESIIEMIGKEIFETYKKKVEREEPSYKEIESVFYNSLIFTFRLIFMAYYEDLYEDILNKHEAFPNYSLKRFYKDKIENKTVSFSQNPYSLWGELKTIWKDLDKGEESKGIPMLNGGLFSIEKTPLLIENKLIQNKELKEILDSLFIFKKDSKEIILREFKSLSLYHLGSIYEGFLEYEFRWAKDKTYLVRSFSGSKGEVLEAYYSQYDYEKLKEISKKNKDKREPIILYEYEKSSLYLSSSSNNRKQSASYYTNDTFTSFQSREAIKSQIKERKELKDLKVLDNACGSGHYLVSFLKEITQEVQENLEEEDFLYQEIQREKSEIRKNLEENLYLNKDQIDNFIDETQILKRILLKKCIYGVDISDIAIELTKLSLWIETFVFGTPLSFLEHHIKEGNSLINFNLEDFEKFYEKNRLFSEKIKRKLEELKKINQLISENPDITKEDSEKSKELYKNSRKDYKEIKTIFDIFLYRNIFDDFLQKEIFEEYKEEVKKRFSEGSKDPLYKELEKLVNASLKEISGNLVSLLYNDPSKIKEDYQNQLKDIKVTLMDSSEISLEAQKIIKDNKFFQKIKNFNIYQEIENLSKSLKFFHWFLEFPEIQEGFDIVIGNPPWNKVKFSDEDFFPQYHSLYSRRASKNIKESIRDRLLNLGEYPFLEELYYSQKKKILFYNTYLKKKYPLVTGSGDLDLFRVFLINNLTLLKPKTGVLSYLTPSWATEVGAGKKLREHIFTERSLEFFLQFENAQHKIFKDVDARFKIAISQIRPEKKEGVIPKTVFMQKNFHFLNQVDFLEKSPLLFNYSLEILKELNGDLYSFKEIEGERDLNFLRKIASSGFQPLAPEYLDFTNDLHMANDKNLFYTDPSLGDNLLYQGDSIYQYDSQYGKRFESTSSKKEILYYVKQEEVKQRLKSKELSRMISFLFDYFGLKGGGKEKSVLTKLEIAKEELESWIHFDFEQPRLVFRSVASGTNERTLITSLLPPNSTGGHSLYMNKQNYFYNEKEKRLEKICPLDRLFFLQGIMNSLICDRLLRYLVSMNVTKAIFLTLPLPQPSDEEIEKNPVYKEILTLSKALSYYNNPEGFEFLKEEISHLKSDLKEEKLDKIRAEIDFLVAYHLYKIEKEEFEFVIENFSILQKNQGSYFTLVKKLYDEKKETLIK